jgi:ribosomal-protein-alanine N-acetyltransferase
VQRELILQTHRCAVTNCLAHDVDDLLVLHFDLETMQFVRQGRPETRTETAALIDTYIAEQAAAGFTKWRLSDLEGDLVGRAGFGQYSDGRGLGYTIRRDLWGQGIATEVGAALVMWHLANGAGCPLYAAVAVANPASRRVAEKIGFHHVRREDHLGVLCDVFRLGPGC